MAINFDASNPPFMYELNQEPAGLHPVIIREAFKRMGFEVKLKSLPWKRVIAGVDEGISGAGGIYMNDERLVKYDYSAPYFTEKLMLYVPTGKEFPFEKLSDLYGKTVGIRRGWSYGSAFDKAVATGKIKVIEDDKDTGLFRLITFNRVDAVIAICECGESNIMNQKLESRVKALPVLFSKEKVYLAFNKNAKMKETLAKFDAVIETMKKDGSFDAILKEEVFNPSKGK